MAKGRCLECNWEGDAEFLIYSKDGYICPRCGEAMIEEILDSKHEPKVTYGEGPGHD